MLEEEHWVISNIQHTTEIIERPKIVYNKALKQIKPDGYLGCRNIYY